ncbi:hypothetical protein EAS56_23735 [Bradyrhizobium guangzhouense]|uniref:Uncharacterized protein n=1 Tax=Bradyrhizobium guangzhouense TaxID=1325095 RepID=A0ABY0E1Z3_9BRAD|nr:hypothetical protein EAS56_23735 [Bradyrhizobium guangzhouense]
MGERALVGNEGAGERSDLCGLGNRAGLAGFSAVIARLDRAIQYSEAVVMEPKGRGVLDPPPSRGMTAVGGG